MLPEDVTDWHAYYRILHEARHGDEDKGEEEAIDLTDPGGQAELMAQFGAMQESGMKVKVHRA